MPSRADPGWHFGLFNMMNTQVFKISGSDLDDTAFSTRFAHGMASVQMANNKTRTGTILVHGGGKELTQLLEKMQVENQFIDGLRVTSASARDAAMMVFSGLTNKRLVAALISAGANALGMSGIDGAAVRVRPIKPELGFVGKPSKVNVALLQQLLGVGLMPVFNPISLGEDGEIYNVNADHVAGALATALHAEMLTFVTNVPGVLNKAKQLLPNLSAVEVAALIADGTITAGMIPKVNTALDALKAGVSRVRICNLVGLQGGGTVFQ